jgi:cell division protein FtsQ
VLGVRLSARGSWSLALSNGARIVVGRAEPEPRLERLVSVLPQLLSGEPRPFERIDLRYTNGFAVRWVEAPAEGEAGDPVPAPAADAPTRAGSDAARPADPNPESRLPNPGFTT